MKILVLGAGAVGGYFGGRLAEKGADVVFLVRPRRADQLREHGLVVRSPHGDINQRVACVLPEQLNSGYDFVILACKAYDLESATSAITPAVGKGTAILPLLNGVAHMEMLGKKFGAERVLGGSCQIAATLTENGEIHHLYPVHKIIFGERSGEKSARCKALEAEFAKTSVSYLLSETIDLAMWEKFVFLAALAGTTCLMRAPIGAIMQTDEGEAIVLEMLNECKNVATASGYTPRDEHLAWSRKVLTERGSVMAASMLRDVERNGKTEAAHIIGDMLRRARKHKLQTPQLRLAYCNLQAYEARQSKT
ncbi:MAG TPA: 2-dehydropantoate 2-reductase [Burkholderiales bacterium]|nr:2-dehydropantoate 2-reductase [Burkholderiales bacterium]